MQLAVWTRRSSVLYTHDHGGEAKAGADLSRGRKYGVTPPFRCIVLPVRRRFTGEKQPSGAYVRRVSCFNGQRECDCRAVRCDLLRSGQLRDSLSEACIETQCGGYAQRVVSSIVRSDAICQSPVESRGPARWSSYPFQL